MLKMDLEYTSGILLVRLNGALTKKNCQKINHYLVPVLAKHKIKKLIYNLKMLKSIDEVGVDAILNTKCVVKKNKGKVYLCEVGEEILEKVKRLHIKTIISEKIALKMIEV